MIFMTRDQMREYDRLAVEEYGMPSVLLMENAGRGAADIVEQYLRPSGAAAILCGGGNNGGDGFVVARHLTNRGYFVRVYLFADKQTLSGDAALNMSIFEKMGGEIIDCQEPGVLANRHDELETSSVIVDAMLGTGLSRDVEGPILEAIGLVNLALPPKVSIDVPSGVSADTGQVLGAAVQATATATFGFLKRGLLLFPGAERAGSVHVLDIGAPAQAADQAGYDGKLLQEEDAAALVTARKADAHKGTCGHVLLMCGSRSKAGASVLCSEASMRAGAGRVTLVSPFEERVLFEQTAREVAVQHLVTEADGLDSEQVGHRLRELLVGKNVIAFGPDCIQTSVSLALAARMVEEATHPIVLDGDALEILVDEEGGNRPIAGPLVMTPHPGEMAKLAGIDVDAVQADRPGVARAQSKRFNAIVVLKGAHTIIAAPDGSLFINPTGNPGMATAGMGAVLTGLIAAFLAQGHDVLESACLGTFLLGLAGDRAALVRGERGLISTDVIDAIPEVLRIWESGRTIAQA